MFSISEGSARVQDALITGVIGYDRLRQEGFEVPDNTRGVGLVSEDPGIVVYIAPRDTVTMEHMSGVPFLVVTGAADYHEDRNGNRVLGRIRGITAGSGQGPGSTVVRVHFRGGGIFSASYSHPLAGDRMVMRVWVLTHPNRASTHEPDALNGSARRPYTPQSSWAEWLDEQKARKPKKAPIPAAEKPLGARVVRFRKKI